MLVYITQMNANDLSLLWDKYKKTKSIELRNQLIEGYLWVVKRVAFKMMKKSFALFVDRESIEAAGNFGLMQAIEKYDPDRGVKFETYAVRRIQGAVIDWLREIDWVPRAVRSNANMYKRAVEGLRGSFAEQPTLQHVADFLHISLELAEILAQDARGINQRFQQVGDRTRNDEDDFENVPSLDEMLDCRAMSPFEEVTRSDNFDELVGVCTEIEKAVMRLYYQNNFEMARIGIVLNLTESCISQIHSRALLKIKDSIL